MDTKEITVKLLTEAFPKGNIEYMREVVTTDAVTHRAGFAALYAATGATIPKKGNLLEWVEKGWSVLQAALSDQNAVIHNIVSEGNKVIAHFHMSALHKGDFAGAPATNKRVEWDEISILTFNEEGKITDLWFMCEEMSLATQIGYNLKLKERE